MITSAFGGGCLLVALGLLLPALVGWISGIGTALVLVLVVLLFLELFEKLRNLLVVQR